MRKRSLGFASLVGGAALMVAAAAPAAAIVGGTDAAQPYSFMASMQFASGDPLCGATLIAPQWLVTAGHCVTDPATLGVADPAKYQFRIGAVDPTQGGELVKADKFIRHQGWDDQLHNDIGLVHLTNPVRARPAAIGTAPPPGATVRQLGWGSTCPHHGCPGAATLQQLDTAIADPSGCTVPDFNSARQLCMDNKGGTASACYGDSGGPAVVAGYGRWLLVGVTSHGQTSPCVDLPGVDTTVSFYADWIAADTRPGGAA
jgi:secreted trypsin-like serine protease